MDIDTRKLTKISIFLNLLEWYEFSVYGFLASTISQLFFKATIHPTLALLQTFAIFAASHFIRPIGSLFFGSLGDRFGRSYTLKLSLILMSVPTILIGMLPTYSQIGWMAPACLLILRLIQGFAAGGEYSLVGCYVYEAAPQQNKGLLCSAVTVSNSIGVLCGSLVHTLLVWIFSPEEIHSWAWRIPFLLGIPLTFYVFRIRHKLLEFQPRQNIDNIPLDKNETPLLTLLSTYKVRVFQSILLMACTIVSFYCMAIWMPTYLAHFLGYPQKIVSSIHAIILCSLVLFALISGWLSDRLGYKRMMIFAIGAIFLSVYALFLGLQGSSYWLLLGIQLLFSVFLNGIDPLLFQYLGDTFPRNVRASGMASLALTSALFGGTAPFICTWLIHETGLITAPALYIMAFCLLALPVALRLQHGRGKAEKP